MMQRINLVRNNYFIFEILLFNNKTPKTIYIQIYINSFIIKTKIKNLLRNNSDQSDSKTSD